MFICVMVSGSGRLGGIVPPYLPLLGIPQRVVRALHLLKLLGSFRIALQWQQASGCSALRTSCLVMCC
jgi:hypothetical protein